MYILYIYIYGFCLNTVKVRVSNKLHVAPLGYVYVDLHSDEEVEKALKKNKDYIGKKSTNK